MQAHLDIEYFGTFKVNIKNNTKALQHSSHGNKTNVITELLHYKTRLLATRSLGAKYLVRWSSVRSITSTTLVKAEFTDNQGAIE
ncbi:MAG: hypothetical protein ACI82S_002094 [Patiriisocius sp.]